MWTAKQPVVSLLASSGLVSSQSQQEIEKNQKRRKRKTNAKKSAQGGNSDANVAIETPNSPVGAHHSPCEVQLSSEQ